MNQPFISALFTDSGRYDARKFAAKQLELPVFLLKRITESRRRILEEKLKHYDKIYSLKRQPSTIATLQPQNPQIVPPKTLARQSPKEPSWKLAPNRYNLKSPLMLAVSRQAGLKGPFQCFSVARTDATICGRNAPTKFVGSKQFIFNPPPGIGQAKSFSVRKPTFEKYPVPKVQKPSTIQPDPTAYFENIMAPKEFRASAHKPVDDLNFYPGTSVPTTYLSIHKPTQSSKLDPWRYEPIDPIEIPGKGHKSVFRARLRAPKFITKKPIKSDFVMETNKVDFGRVPRRPISFNPLTLFERPISVRLNTLHAAGRRYKRATLKNVAFSSGTTRFGQAPFKNQLKVRPKTVPQPVKSFKIGIRPPLYSVPVAREVRRFVDRTGFSFSPMPDAKLIDEAINYEVLKLKRQEMSENVED